MIPIHRIRPLRHPFVRPRLEELESRALPSAAGWEVHPLSNVVPLATYPAAQYLTPGMVRDAYGFSRVPYDGSGQTIAIVDAYDDPNVYSDLQTFDRAFGLPDPPSFIKAAPQGTPPVNAQWSGEIALDVEWAHAIAPGANILLVESASADGLALLRAVDYARARPGVVAVSMSWGTPEFLGESTFDGYFTTPAGHAGITFVAAAGDQGYRYGPDWPSVSPNVLAVGGTGLWVTSTGAYGAEEAWGAGGGGYSPVVTEPGYQAAAQHSWRRTTPDVSYNAYPSTGFYVYDSVPDAAGATGWFAYGGTSAGAPQWAALIALADQGRAQLGRGPLADAQFGVYHLSTLDFHDVTSGSNGYAATAGYDVATGLGTPYADRVVRDLVWYENLFATATGPYGGPTNAAIGRYAEGGAPAAGPTPAGRLDAAVVLALAPARPERAPTADRQADPWTHPGLLRGMTPTIRADGGTRREQISRTPRLRPAAAEETDSADVPAATEDAAADEAETAEE